MEEAAFSCRSHKLCALFVTILVHGNPAVLRKLWEKHKKAISEDICYRNGDRKSTTSWKAPCLSLLESKLISVPETTPKDFNLPNYDQHLLQLVENFNETESTESPESEEQVQQKIDTMTDEQADVFNTVISSVDENPTKLFFLDAPSGTGKTYMLNLIISITGDTTYIPGDDIQPAITSELCIWR
ncbi:hypothetical protein Pcinc_002133 [Petrolisthes cinctipes]|uniref:ATP-dependent DNA helicase n=1 Tax=Petrolisthes cinctipes TaxID=88211 RepID=A0AAE1L5M0_PETCI|nr:hypothetical protein Pcinc_002133 [Petrolisthes cinctipes]